MPASQSTPIILVLSIGKILKFTLMPGPQPWNNVLKVMCRSFINSPLDLGASGSGVTVLPPAKD